MSELDANRFHGLALKMHDAVKQASREWMQKYGPTATGPEIVGAGETLFVEAVKSVLADFLATLPGREEFEEKLCALIITASSKGAARYAEKTAMACSLAEQNRGQRADLLNLYTLQVAKGQ